MLGNNRTTSSFDFHINHLTVSLDQERKFFLIYLIPIPTIVRSQDLQDEIIVEAQLLLLHCLKPGFILAARVPINH
jgi:hypothetical protein